MESLAHFEQNYVQPKVKEKVLQARQYVIDHREELAEAFRESLRGVCRRIKERQQNGQRDPVGYIQYAMLRSALLEKRPVYRIDSYNKEWYFDPTQKTYQGEYEGGGIFRFLDELESELEESRRLYLDQISVVDLEKIKRREAARFNALMIDLAGYALYQKVIPELAEIVKEDELEIRVGEYYDICEVVYKEDIRHKDAAGMKEWLEDHHENQYVAAVLKNLDLSGGDYRELDLRRVNFSGSNLSSSRLEGCQLVKTRFTDCVLPKADFSGAAIYDADFRHADLRDAVFRYAEGPVSGTSIHHSVESIRGVDFTGANLEAADFRDAKLAGANFRGANLKRAMFDRTAQAEIQFDATQLEEIIWCEGIGKWTTFN